ncbi:MAG: hypothetical protein WD598_12175 [Acidimicrobiia bacterium]
MRIDVVDFDRDVNSARAWRSRPFADLKEPVSSGEHCTPNGLMVINPPLMVDRQAARTAENATVSS